MTNTKTSPNAHCELTRDTCVWPFNQERDLLTMWPPTIGTCVWVTQDRECVCVRTVFIKTHNAVSTKDFSWNCYLETWCVFGSSQRVLITSYFWKGEVEHNVLFATYCNVFWFQRGFFDPPPLLEFITEKWIHLLIIMLRFKLCKNTFCVKH